MTGTRDGSVVCLAGASGDREWVYGNELGTVMSPAIADLDGDGQPEVYATDFFGHVISLTLSGRLRWTAEVMRIVLVSSPTA